jgi:pre-mRNA-splicing factor SYF1
MSYPDANGICSTDVNFIATQALAKSKEVANGIAAAEEGGDRADAMAALERQARAPTGFVPASGGPVGGVRKDEKVEAGVANDDEIDLGEL